MKVKVYAVDENHCSTVTHLSILCTWSGYNLT